MKAQVLTFLFLTNLFLCSCKTLQRNIEEDTYAIINMELERASKNKDSLFIIDWGKNYDLNNEEILQIKNDSNAIRHFIEFLDKQGINWNHEISFFEKQLKKPFKIDKKKISVDNALIIKNSEYREILDLEFNFDYTSKRTYLKLNRPVFTEDYNFLSNNGTIPIPDIFYEALAWGGLKESGVKAYTDLPESKKAELNSSLEAYYHSTTKNCPNTN